MEFTYFILLLCITLSFIHLLSSNFRRRRSPKLPPGPNPFPIIGNILQLGPKPHQSLTNLSKIHGPLMHLKLGSIDTVVVSSPEIAKEILQQHDHGFPGRMTTAATKAFDHHLTSVACLPVGKKWRSLRKICREEMFSTQRLDASRELRRAKLQNLVDYVQECCDDRKIVDIGEAAFVTSLNLISNTLFSVDFADYSKGSSQELKEIIHGLMGAFGSFNVADYFPIVGAFDPQRIKRDAEGYIGKLLAVFDGIIDRRRELPEKKNDLLEALISQENQSELSRDDIKHLLLDLFVAGTDTTSGTVEWVMTEVLRNPSVVSKAKAELQTVIGENKALIEESDITKLSYLQAVIKETFRYHPPGPFIARRKDENDVVIGDHAVPKNAIVLINIWAIGRDSRIWRDPDSFEPQRFLEGDDVLDLKGQNFELIPFGAGRRICPGLPLAYRMVHLMVATLIHNFDWKFETDDEVDLDDKFGLSLQKALPLKALPIKLSLFK
ncbi:hypothetical protein C2S52_000837 [Perilla frutescens var. hirtella]|nr:hypothetical protein C2S51_007520 [Perilla frutescens var. frutescens]KAH6800373.1 hypothetical protein C2S52_000837 [Perilla frutescens var. hirtella]